MPNSVKGWNHYEAFFSYSNIKILQLLGKKKQNKTVKYFLFKIILEANRSFALLKFYFYIVKKRLVEKKKNGTSFKKRKKFKNGHENLGRKDIREEFIRKRELAFNTIRW